MIGITILVLLSGVSSDVSVTSSDGSTVVALSSNGTVSSVTVNGLTTTTHLSVSGLFLSLQNARPKSVSSGTLTPIAGGGYEIDRKVLFATGEHAAAIERFVPAAGSSVSWSIRISSNTTTKVWSPAFGAQLGLGFNRSATNRSLWMPWDTPGCDETCSLKCIEGYGSPLMDIQERCFGSTQLSYGSSTSVPMVSLMDSETDSAISLSLAPNDNIQSVSGVTTTSQKLTDGRTLGISFGSGYRVGAQVSAVVKQTYYITGTSACARHILQQYSEVLHPEYFRPPNMNVHYRASGMGSYAGTQGPLNQIVDGVPLNETWKKVGYKVNWDATFWWPYIMQIAPTINGSSDNFTELWGSSFDKVPGFNNRLSQVHVHASYAIRDNYYKQWADQNVTVLGYFNGWELGQQMVDYPPDPSTCPPTNDLWRHSPCFIHTYLDSALCTSSSGHKNVGPGSGGWDGDTELDPGTEIYRNFLKTMIQNHLSMEPHFMGVASDGIRAVPNYRSDDGITCHYVSDDNCTLLQDGFTAWASLMNVVGPMLHEADKIFSANTINGPRLHLMRHVDLIITEENADDYAKSSANAWLALAKPAVMWTTSTTGSAGSADIFFQRLLHLGLFPMPPMPSADHSIRPGDLSVHQQYEDYGVLFSALKGRRWILRPHAVSVEVKNQSALNGEEAASPLLYLDKCSESDTTQLWVNATFDAGTCQGALENSDKKTCLVVQNDKFSPSQCDNGASGSNIWYYPCPSPSPVSIAPPSPLINHKDTLRAPRDCPLHENIRWKATPVNGTDAFQLRSAVPATTGPLSWDLCLVSSNTAIPSTLTLKDCSTAGSISWWDFPKSNTSVDFFSIRQGTNCISKMQPPAPAAPLVVNVFQDLSGAEVVVVTSPSQVVIGDASITLRGLNVTSAQSLHVTCATPGDTVFSAAGITEVGVGSSGEVVISAKLNRGAVVIRVEFTLHD